MSIVRYKEEIMKNTWSLASQNSQSYGRCGLNILSNVKMINVTAERCTDLKGMH